MRTGQNFMKEMKPKVQLHELIKLSPVSCRGSRVRTNVWSSEQLQTVQVFRILGTRNHNRSSQKPLIGPAWDCLGLYRR